MLNLIRALLVDSSKNPYKKSMWLETRQVFGEVRIIAFQRSVLSMCYRHGVKCEGVVIGF